MIAGPKALIPVLLLNLLFLFNLFAGCAKQKDLSNDFFYSKKSTSEKIKIIQDTGIARTAEELDLATDEEILAVVNKEILEETKFLGEIIVSLGDPAETGFWVKTSLVSTESQGRIVDKSTNKSVDLILLPLEDEENGGQISLSAMRALEIPITSIFKVLVSVY
tara:strand:- start:19 stop:510 length:492 start_codon:yes stop_codon:yes gene_type:complete